MTEVKLDIISGITLRMKDHPTLDWSKIAEDAFIEAMDKKEAGVNPREKHIAWLQAQIAQMDRFIDSRSKKSDPVGYYQYTKRRDGFKKELTLLLEGKYETTS